MIRTHKSGVLNRLNPKAKHRAFGESLFFVWPKKSNQKVAPAHPCARDIWAPARQKATLLVGFCYAKIPDGQEGRNAGAPDRRKCRSNFRSPSGGILRVATTGHSWPAQARLGVLPNRHPKSHERHGWRECLNCRSNFRPPLGQKKGSAWRRNRAGKFAVLMHEMFLLPPLAKGRAGVGF